jgi:DNA-binding Lrp family transcriptional regulator
MRHSSLDLLIISAVELNALRSIREIAYLAKSKEHRIRYRLERLRSSGLLGETEVVIDCGRLGLTHHTLFFSLSVESLAVRRKVLSHLAKRPAVSWLFQIGGEFQYGASFTTTTIQAVGDELDILAETFGSVILRKSLSSQRTFSYFGRRYLGSLSLALDFFTGVTHADLSKDESRILNYLRTHTISDWATCAKALSIPRATFDRHRIQLEKSGVIRGYSHRIDALRVGRHSYIVLIVGRGTPSALRAQLKTFSMREKSIVYFTEAIGAWDFELGVEVADPRAIAELCRALYDSVGLGVEDIKILPVLEYLKYRAVPKL